MRGRFDSSVPLEPRWILRLGAPTFARSLLVFFAVALVVFARSPGSNHIFDEQEALLGNPYVAGEIPWGELFRVDFWGLPPHRSIGSYRPLPNLLWRALSRPLFEPLNPWLLQLANVAGHAAVSAGLASFVYRATTARLVGWCTGAAFLLTALLTEAVAGVVGLADVLGGAGVVLGLHALRLPLWWMPFGVFLAVCFGLGGKESAIAAVPLVACAALASAPLLHRERSLRWVRATVALLAATAAFVAFTEFRKVHFPAPLPPELLGPPPSGFVSRLLHDFLLWFQQPRLPRDPMNNPLLATTTPLRLEAALRVYLAGAVQLVFPWQLSGDYSFPQIPVPPRAGSLASALGLVLLLGPLVVGGWLVLRGRGRLVALGLLWVPLAYFPHSNLLVLLPTVRAERLWYVPALGAAFIVGKAAALLLARERPSATAAAVAFFLFQTLQARAHAVHYSDDLVFWRATRIASPKSAKAHLNYAVMLGARGDLEARRVVGETVLELAPEWAMAHVYQGDVLCRLGRIDDAWRHYRAGFERDPHSQNQIALALQCLWDRGGVPARRAELLDLGHEHRGTWLGYLATDIVHNGELYGGVDPKYRAKGYNHGANRKETGSAGSSAAGDAS